MGISDRNETGKRDIYHAPVADTRKPRYNPREIPSGPPDMPENDPCLSTHRLHVN